MAKQESSLKKPRRAASRGAVQFSLRTLLALTAACCLALGWKADRAFRQKRAVAAIVALSGRVDYEGDEPARGKLSSALVRQTGLSREFVDQVSSVYWAGAPLKDADLDCLGDLPQLSTLCLASTPITDAGLLRLAACRRLEFVDLRFTQVSEAGVERLRKALPQAKILRFSDVE